MNKNRHVIPVENNVRKIRKQPKQPAPSQVKSLQPTLTKRVERAPLAKYRDYVELQRYERGLQVINVMPYFHEEVQELMKEGWRIMQRWKAPKYVYEKRTEDAEHLQVT